MARAPSDFTERMLTEAEARVFEDPDQAGKWLWTIEGATHGPEQSFDTQAEATRDVITTIAGCAMAFDDLSDEQWEALSDDDKVALVRTTFNPGASASPRF